jgi:hypothetical protein
MAARVHLTKPTAISTPKEVSKLLKANQQESVGYLNSEHTLFVYNILHFYKGVWKV